MISNTESAQDTEGLRVLRAIRLIRLFRIFKLGRYSSGMRLMAESVRSSWQALWVLCFFLAIGVVLFSSTLYYAEKISCPNVEDMSQAAKDLYNAECRESGDGWSKSGELCCDEYGSPAYFPSIVETFWWAIVTM